MRTLRLVALGVVCVFLLAALVGPWLAPFDPLALDLQNTFASPSLRHPLGTGDNGVDLLSVLLHGARLAGVVAVTVVGLSLVFGTAVGVISGAYGGRVDNLCMGLVDWVQAFPSLVLNIAILALVAEPGVMHVVLALSLNGWVIYARIARAQALGLRNHAFIEAARSVGASPRRIMIKHMLPNISSALVVQATAGLGGAILAESTLSFLGLGPGKSISWGALLDQGTSVLLRFPHVALVSGWAIASVVLGFNLTGDWLRDHLVR